ncbi:GNAT family N-acetyltransferase [Alkalibacillus haloalkaliphilus]|uniref:Acetyltransferase n=1 Tax=Alkalibacillus haloalkaliphilus TaxID=94136 RepID=A0A511W509_9BACI|nr:GNAT family protein [Alkalibacillus haloalkaliphilus]GEN46179.1 acetyltransferase [Alkalibacillus haloalkaliphilus]
MFSSNRLYLRKVEMEDTELYQSWRNDVDVMYSTNPSLDVYSYEDTRRFVENVLVNSNTSKSYIIVERNGETPIGITSLINMDYKNRNAECIIDLGNKQYWGKGYAKEALTLLLNYAFMEQNLHRVSLKVFDFNEAAIHLYQKLGFKEEGRSREALYRGGNWRDIIHMGLLKDEFNN